MIKSHFLLSAKTIPAWVGLSVWLTLLFFGAMLWAKARDPFRRVWFKVRTPYADAVDCLVVLPKAAAQPMPMAVYLYGSGGKLLQSGEELRQIAETGLAAVGI